MLARTSYPVLALDRHPPQLCNDALARLDEQERERERVFDELRGGVLRADAQLRGRESVVAAPLSVDPLPDLPLSLAIFPVKTRLRGFDEKGGKVRAKLAEPWGRAEKRY